MRIALGQIDMGFEEKEKAMTICSQLMAEAKEKEVDFVIFPEMTLTGFSLNPETYGEDRQNSPSIAFFKEETRKNGVAVCFGLPVYENGVATNHCIYLDENGEQLVDYAKIHPFSFGAEAKHYIGGSELQFAEVKGIPVSPMICYDLRFPEPFQVLSEKSKIITVIASWPTPRREHWMTLLKARAIENQCFILGVNRSGDGGGLSYIGDSMAVSPTGEVLAHVEGGNGLTIVDIDLAEVDAYRSTFPVKADRKVELYNALWKNITLNKEGIPMITKKITDLRHALHNCAEISGKEEKTKALLMDFLKKNTTLELIPCGEGFYAAHREENTTKSALALRADYDALAMPDGSASHLCGHDGHAAALCGAALMAEDKTFGRDIFFLFQPAEETGAGAGPCCELFRKETVDEIYGSHNLPGLPLGQVTTRPDTFACASRGVTLIFKGKPTHAAYPENGISPALAVGKLFCELPLLSAPEKYTGMTLCTIIGVEMGEKAFGAAAEKAEIWLTLRAEHDCDLTALDDAILALAEQLSAEYHLEFSHEMQDVFPATENTPEKAEKVLSLLGGKLLEVPMRWSEDFGHYLNHCKGAFFGIGAGEDHPPLHTEHYEYPDSLLQPTMDIFYKLMEA